MKKVHNINKYETIPFTTPWQYLRFVSKPHRGYAFTAMAIVTLASAIDQSVSYIFKLIVDAVQVGDVKSALWWGLTFPVVLFFVQVLYRTSGYIGARWIISVRKDGYDYLFNHILKHSHGYFSDRFAGSVHNKIRNVVEGLDHLIPDILWTYLNYSIAFIVTFVLILTVDLTSAFLFVLLCIILTYVNIKMAPKKEKASYENAEANSTLHANMIDVISNIGATRQYAEAKSESELIATFSQKQKRTNITSWYIGENILLVNATILFVFNAIIFYLLVGRWEQGFVTVGDFVLIASLVTGLSGTLVFVGRGFSTTARTLGEMKEGLSELLVPFEIVDEKDAKDLIITKPSIEWEDVTFRFGEAKVFENFNLNIPAGQRLGLVGSSGAGKSTFVSLLLRQHEINAGQILISDQDITTVTQESLRREISVVPQEPALFHRSISDNISYGRKQATKEEIIEAAKKAQAHEFIMSLPLGYDTLVGERGVKLSGGQRQRIAIARAILKNSPILILDEATSALDSESEVAIQKALHELMEGKTVVAIAHRLSTLREMDRIVVLSEGEIVEDGTHDTLKDNSNIYAKLWSHQAGGFIE